MRTFLSVTPDAATAVAIEEWCSLCWPLLSGLVPVQNYHLTLAFLGEVDIPRLQSLQDILDGTEQQSFVLTLDEVGYWPDSTSFWLGPNSVPEQLQSLATACRLAANRVGIKVKNKRYHPHLTLARRTSTAPGAPLVDPDFQLQFDSMQLYQSIMDRGGVRYAEINSWSLA